MIERQDFLNRIRVKFSRGEEVKFISHLDLLKVFERALRRSRLPIEYSHGFNPHPQMVFGLPLQVGVTSDTEYADFELAEYVAPDEFANRLNNQLPRGLRIIEVQGGITGDNIMASVIKASYDVLVCTGRKCTSETYETTGAGAGTEAVQATGTDSETEAYQAAGTDSETEAYQMAEKYSETEAYQAAGTDSETEAYQMAEIGDEIEALLNQTEIFIDKSSKKGIKSINIRPMIHKLEVKQFPNPTETNEDCKIGNSYCISMLLSAGSAENLKPDLVIKSLSIRTGWEIKVIKIHRTGLFI